MILLIKELVFPLLLSCNLGITFSIAGFIHQAALTGRGRILFFLPEGSYSPSGISVHEHKPVDAVESNKQKGNKDDADFFHDVCGSLLSIPENGPDK